MNEFDTIIFDQLDAWTPVPRSGPDWADVLRRVRRRRVRRLVVAVAAAVALLASAAAVTAALGGFDRWLNGKPGKPASVAEQRGFERANGRSWAAFPTGTRLRELIRTEVAGKSYALFGFRSGTTLCLKLEAVSDRRSTNPSCVPVSTLAHADAPIVVVNRDSGFDDRHAHPSVEFSFGIAADGVRAVDVIATDGLHRAVVGGNAYLFVEDEPNTGNRVLAVSAQAAGGKGTTINFRTIYGYTFARSQRLLPPPGPRHIQAPIRHPMIGWYERGEKRGVAGDKLKLDPSQRFGTTSSTGRFVKPDPLSNIVVGLDGNLCLVLIPGEGGGLSCSDASDFFSRGPMNVIMAGSGGTESTVVAGAAADGVARLVVFGSDGQRLTVPLQDNVFATRVSLYQFPIRLVAYDRRGQVAGIQTFEESLVPSTPPASVWTPTGRALRVRGPNGGSATLRYGRVVQQLRCWRAHFSAGQSRRGCVYTYPTGPWVVADLVQPSGKDLFVIGDTRAPVRTVRLRFADGATLVTRPVRGLFMFAIPNRYLRPERQLAFLRGYDHDGQVVQRAAVLFKARQR